MNNGRKLTQAEADRMLNMIKKSLDKNLSFRQRVSLFNLIWLVKPKKIYLQQKYTVGKSIV